MHRQTSRRPDPARNQVTARLQSLLGRSVPEAGRGRPGPIDPLLKLAIVCALAGLIAVPLHYGLSPFLVEFDELVGLPVLRTVLLTSGALLLGHAALTLVFSLLYRPTPAPRRDLPRCTVIVPAYNEGPMVGVALGSILVGDYPRDRLEILAIDDGSTDDTWSHIQRIAREHPDVVRAIRMPKNGGKREALRAGFSAATGEVVVSVDSDSRLDPDALRQIVAPIMADARVAAVAGKVLVLNRYSGLITRLLAIRFFLAFDLGRAAQSRFGAVLCCPGALTAYRRSAVMAVLGRWSTQTFLGEPCTIGEDRALTTWLLRTGHRAVYQSTAVVHTLVPTHYAGLTRMYLRWERGNLREGLTLLPVLLTRWRREDRWWPTIDILLELGQVPLACVAVVLLVAHLLAAPLDILRVVATISVFALVQSLYTLRSERSTDFLYGVGYAFFAFLCLQWIYPWSLVTVRNGRWLTR
ncbi:glycosyltransferase family 2 protein [Nannocystis sp. ILAH1]|uniref:glycosyltransferase family 2 protein n=1 Tax=unclassified Nannocystis TaxID=2627009 RepID=UPI00226EA97C|nr:MULTISPECIES: glycosyltransferase family 2 protein [unclassified Nannocystis]MCY0986014.1 glycosyltransferase family 2 protein [Nannocystis sp. ILAH1]MCY1068610.1 glycosyltransferase family 2 protein [Nannocystis sp. RBIL2]